jgi:hypothetical protein
VNALAISLQTYFTTFAHTQRDLSVNTITSYRDTWRMLLKYLTATLAIPADALDFDSAPSPFNRCWTRGRVHRCQCAAAARSPNWRQRRPGEVRLGACAGPPPS